MQRSISRLCCACLDELARIGGDPLAEVVIIGKYLPLRQAVAGSYSAGVHAAAESTGSDARGREVRAEYLQCGHCQFTWMKKPGSNKKRGFCRHCMKPLCGKKECAAKCVPMAQRLEILSKWGRSGLRRILAS